jgi:hypothetical protein
MKTLGRTLVAAAICMATLGFTGTAHAGRLNSAVVGVVGTDRNFCSGVNVGTSVISSVTVNIIATTGVVLATNTCSSVLSGQDCFTSTTIGFPNSSHCSVTFTGSSKSIRGAMTVVDTSGNDKFVLPAL